jgi:hypothetical protein
LAVGLKRLRAAALAGFAALVIPQAAGAHSFGRPYNLPVPFWMYAYGASAALGLSFLIVAYFVTAPAAEARARSRDLGATASAIHRLRLIPVLRGFSVFSLLLSILTGFLGSADPYRNINMTLFWIVFVLGFAYLTAVVGDLYAAINPWRAIAAAIDRLSPGFAHGRMRYPRRLAHWPALGLYMAFIWVELFGHTHPFSLSAVLLGYSALNLLGVWLFGAAAWFRHCEFLGVFLGLVAKLAPLDPRPATRPGEAGRLYLRAPFTGVLHDRPESLSLAVFVLFMLSSTAFDGLRETASWVQLFWTGPFHLVQPWVTRHPTEAYTVLRAAHVAFESACLFLSPFLYLAVYVLFISAAKLATRSPRPVRELALSFAYSLLPIALVYNVTHYYTLILTQGVQIVGLASDPFGWGWNLFGTAGWLRAPIVLDMSFVWHSQVGLIVAGHIVSVYLAHLEASRIFPARREAVLSQLPMLGLMVLFTTAGLWILAQPVAGGS